MNYLTEMMGQAEPVNSLAPMMQPDMRIKALLDQGYSPEQAQMMIQKMDALKTSQPIQQPRPFRLPSPTIGIRG